MHDHVQQFVNYIKSRQAVYLAREAGEAPPWTNDPILQEYKFCNNLRELDRTTRWISAKWCEPNKNDPDLWFALVVARRCINLRATLRDIGYPVPWDPEHFLSKIARRKESGKPIFNSGAYKLHLSQQGGDLAELQVKLILNPLWEEREEYRPRNEDTLMRFHDRLAAVRFMGGFYAAQVVADLKYSSPLRHAEDWWRFAASGPGSRRGLNRVLGRLRMLRGMKKNGLSNYSECGRTLPLTLPKSESSECKHRTRKTAFVSSISTSEFV